MTLAELGWSHFFATQIQASEAALKPARVTRQDINGYQLISAEGELQATLPGRLRRSAYSKADLPTVGDWVLTSAITGGEKDNVQIERLLERQSRFSRQEAGESIDEQVIAANVDTTFIVCGLDDDFNPARIERYLLLSRNSGTQPVILLNKTDICDNQELFLDRLRPIAKATPYYFISAKDNLGLEAIDPYLAAGETCALIGSSGVGKSTIINVLLGYDRFTTGAVRTTDSRGRHTTTFREMVRLPCGALIIDTPGMRELRVWADSIALEQSFEDIAELALGCKFSDCQHVSEPGCAIAKAISDGDLPAERFERYIKLRRELSELDSQQVAATRTERKQARRRISKLLRNRPDKRD
tara:strand:+ start:139 stop:1209 length:1071 start_codon:yes stop_codon:yes gene_type:complete